MKIEVLFQLSTKPGIYLFLDIVTIIEQLIPCLVGEDTTEGIHFSSGT